MGVTNSFSSYISLKPKCPPYLNVIVAIETAMTSSFLTNFEMLRCRCIYDIQIFVSTKTISSKIKFNLSIFNIFTNCMEPP